MKELPYFKFYTNEWLQGDISSLSFLHQGLFIQFCCLAWLKGGYIKMNELIEHRLNMSSTTVKEAFNELLKFNIIKYDKENGLYIEFIIEQLADFQKKIEQCSDAGKKSFAKRLENKLNLNDRPTTVKQTFNHKDKEVDKEVDKIKKFIPENCFLKIDDFKNWSNEFLAGSEIETIYKNEKVDALYFIEFVREQESIGENGWMRTPLQIREHFVKWAKKQKKEREKFKQPKNLVG
jgi:DNA-binding transcriptional regulator GbsR (MarR family)